MRSGRRPPEASSSGCSTEPISKARGSQAEQGVNILFATFGLLRWQETPTSSDSFAPLILVPVQLTRASALDPFQISALDEELSLNPTLVEKLRTQFDVTLTLGDEDLRQPLSSVLSTLQTALERQPGWQVSPDVYLGLFQFHKLSMYRDLHAYEEKAKAHPVVRALAGEPRQMPQTSRADLPSERDLDARVDPHSAFQILDADASQMQAIAAAVKGGSFIIQGPPGTGKSQTIANVIAQCLANGKTVLFVRRQQSAAPEAVHRRPTARPDCATPAVELLQPPAPTRQLRPLSSWGRAAGSGSAKTAQIVGHPRSSPSSRTCGRN